MRAARFVLVAGLLLLAACEADSYAGFWYARAATPDGKAWQVYFGHAWRDVIVDGVRPPSYVAPRILDADNRYVFAGQLDTAGRGRFDLPVFHLSAWNIFPPIKRILAKGDPPDTAGFRWLTEDDFRTLSDYQQFSLCAAAQAWPWDGKGIESPDSSQSNR